MKKKLIIGNWKMYIERPDEARALALQLKKKARDSKKVDIGIAPPFVFVAELVRLLESSPIKVGAQALSPYGALPDAAPDKARTGDVSAEMLKRSGALFVIVGHSERRAVGDTKDAVHSELEQAARAGLMPVLCVGEREREHSGEHFEFVEEQLRSALKDIPKNLLKKLVVAYEPVWAIGKEGSSAIRPELLEEMIIFIRKVLAEVLDRQAALKVPVLYGGSVEPANARAFVDEGGASGLLVGRASANAEQFLEIIRASQN